ncbi:MAG TPA: amidohydrolase family protein [Longimicrobiaceae bacterium]|nr:amidohydrolase family protein [Longimicrobiaceae bacterium]
MRHPRLPFATALFAAAACAGEPPPPAVPPWSAGEGAPLAITRVAVVDVNAGDAGSALLRDRTVLVRHGRIAAVGPAREVRIPRDARVVDGRGKFLVPGLWDAHAHVSHAGPGALPVYAAHGVTSVRDLGGRLPVLLAWRRQVREGTLAGPELFVAGPAVEGAYWLDPVLALFSSDSVLRAYPFLERSPRLRVSSPAGALAAVDSLRRLGVDLVKFRNVRGDEARALLSEARRLGIPVAGHAPGGMGLGEAADSGVRSIEHVETAMLRLGDAGPAARRAEFARIARAGTALTPTLLTDRVYRQTPDSVARAAIADTAGLLNPRRRRVSRGLLENWRFGLETKRLEGPNDWAGSHRRQVADLRLAHEAGVPILVGTDLGVALVYPGSGVHEEMRLLVEEGGLSPFDALRGATVLPARSLGVHGRVGAVYPGLEADLVLLDADPLRDVAHTERIRAVVLDGRLFTRAELDALLEEGERMAWATFGAGR